MNKVFLFAYTKCNLGDDLFIRAILHRYPKVRFYLRGDQDQTLLDRFRDEKNLTILSDESWFIRTAAKIRPSFAARIKNHQEQRCNAVVYIGGSIFTEYPNWETILTWWKYEAEHCRFFALGSNFGPWHTKEYRDSMATIFAKMQDVCFRDRYSKELFSEVKTVRYAPDILFGYELPKVEVNQKQLFFSVINCTAKEEGDNNLRTFDDEYTIKMGKMADWFIEQGWTILFASFCEAEEDEQGAAKIKAQMKHTEDVRIIKYKGINTNEILTAIVASELIVASRFHATILGFAAGRPVIPVIYSNKTKNVLTDMEFSGYSFDIRNWGEENVENCLEKILGNVERQYLKDRELFSERSTEHFEKLDTIIN